MIATTIQSINLILKSNFDNAKICGLAESIVIRNEETEITIPALIEQDGTSKDVLFDDRFAFGTYHRIAGKTYFADSSKGYGSLKVKTEIDDMKLVVWGFRFFMQPTALEETIYALLSDIIDIQSVNFESRQCFNEEIQGENYFVPNDGFMFVIRYRVQEKKYNNCN